MSRLDPDLVLGPAALVTAAAAFVLLLGFVAAARHPRRAGAVFAENVRFAMELFLAAGLIRLATVETFEALATVAGIIAVRQIIRRGIRFGARASATT